MPSLDVIEGRSSWACDVGHVTPWLKSLPPGSVHNVVTSPPYWGMRSYLPDDHPDKAHEIGTEKSPQEYVDKLVAVFGEVRRVMHPTGTLFLNLGDTYASQGGSYDGRSDNQPNTGQKRLYAAGKGRRGARHGVPGVKTKDLLGLPWRLALAMRDEGWYLRSDIIWHKPNGLTESVNDRAPRSHEYVFMLTPNPKCFYDKEATRLRPTQSSPDGILPRSVWTINVARFKGSHFATMAPELAERCIRAATSLKGCCPRCGCQAVRVLHKERLPTRPGTKSKVGPDSRTMSVGNRDTRRHITRVKTLGWRASCKCEEPLDSFVPAVVMDPFAGSGTTLAVARKLGRRAIGCELFADYLPLIQARMSSVTQTFA